MYKNNKFMYKNNIESQEYNLNENNYTWIFRGLSEDNIKNLKFHGQAVKTYGWSSIFNLRQKINKDIDPIAHIANDDKSSPWLSFEKDTFHISASKYAPKQSNNHGVLDDLQLENYDEGIGEVFLSHSKEGGYKKFKDSSILYRSGYVIGLKVPKTTFEDPNYIIDLSDKDKIQNSQLINEISKKYDSKIFDKFKSFANADKEVLINILNMKNKSGHQIDSWVILGVNKIKQHKTISSKIVLEVYYNKDKKVWCGFSEKHNDWLYCSGNGYGEYSKTYDLVKYKLLTEYSNSDNDFILDNHLRINNIDKNKFGMFEATETIYEPTIQQKQTMGLNCNFSNEPELLNHIYDTNVKKYQSYKINKNLNRQFISCYNGSEFNNNNREISQNFVSSIFGDILNKKNN